MEKIAKQEFEWTEDEMRKELYDTSEVIKKALIHDLEETLTGDILFPMKIDPFLGPPLRTIIKDIVDADLFNNISDSTTRKYYIRLWHTSKDNSKEGLMVAAMDKFEILLYALSELSLGNKQFIDIFSTALNILIKDFSHIQTLQELLPLIKEEVVKLIE